MKIGKLDLVFEVLEINFLVVTVGVFQEVEVSTCRSEFLKRVNDSKILVQEVKTEEKHKKLGR